MTSGGTDNRGAAQRTADSTVEPTVRADATFERTWLDQRSWVDVSRGWLTGADTLFESLIQQVPWKQERLFRYERWVEEPRLTAWCPLAPTGSAVPDPALLAIHRAVRNQCGVPFDGFALARYRHGRDGQAFHRDRDLRWLDNTVIALLILGARRPFLMRPASNHYDHSSPDGGATHNLAPAGGDLMIMGGACQVGWEHSVPKVHSPVGERLSVQWRWTSKTGRPVQGASYRAPRHFGR